MFLQIKNLSKTIESISLFEDFNLNMEKGSIVTIVGNSGCGKSTLFRVLTGLDKDYSGKIFLDDVKIDVLPPGNRPVSIMFQEPTLFPHLNVLDNISFPLKCKNIKKNKRYEIANNILENLKLSGFSQKYIHKLSGGEKQRVCLARALITKPKLLLLDEPFSSLDLTLSRDIISFVKDVVKEHNITTLFVTHNYEEAHRMSDRILLFNDRKIIEDKNLLDKFFNNGVYIENNFVSMDKLILDDKSGIPVEIVSKLNLYGVEFISFKIENSPEKLIQSPTTNFDIKKQYYIKVKKL